MFETFTIISSNEQASKQGPQEAPQQTQSKKEKHFNPTQEKRKPTRSHNSHNPWIFRYLKEKGNNLKEKDEIADMTEEEKVRSHLYILIIVTQKKQIQGF